jgi:hypothetical protein
VRQVSVLIPMASGRPIPPLVSEIQVATTNAGARAQGGLTPTLWRSPLELGRVFQFTDFVLQRPVSFCSASKLEFLVDQNDRSRNGRCDRHSEELCPRQQLQIRNLLPQSASPEFEKPSSISHPRVQPRPCARSIF